MRHDKRSDFYYELPEELIAQTPLEQRDHSRVLALDRRSGAIRHTVFSALPGLLRPGDMLVMNDSRVINARLSGVTEGGTESELLLLRELETGLWECLARPGRKCRTGAKLSFGNGRLDAVVESVRDNGDRVVRFSGLMRDKPWGLGAIPLPPYIGEKLDDPERYQTVYAKHSGSAAAPTAGLHFTPELLEALRENGIGLSYITLHVGVGTFRPVKAEHLDEHVMHEEWFSISEETAGAIRRTRDSGGRVICVGTTVCRTLEAASQATGLPAAGSGKTSIFIRPGYSFRVTDGLITNFHLPESTLIMLVCAFAGYEYTMNAYHEAIRERYRFYSFGDCCLIL